MKSAFADAIGQFITSGGKITRCPEGNGLVDGVKPRTLLLIGKAKTDRAMVEKRGGQIAKYLAGMPSREFTLGELREYFGLRKGSIEAALMVVLQDGRVTSRRRARRTLYYRAAPKVSP